MNNNNKKSIINIYNDDNNNNDMRLFWIQFKSVYQLGECVIFPEMFVAFKFSYFDRYAAPGPWAPEVNCFIGRNWLLLAVWLGFVIF